MKTKPLFSVIASFFLIWSSTYCQNNGFDNYTPLKSKGPLPTYITLTSTEKYEAKQKTIGKADKKELKQLKKEFYLQSAFSLDEFLRSGRVLYNDTVGVYLKGLFNRVKKAAKIEDSSADVFVLKSNTPNAFANDEGFIFVTTGLISRLQNEAQLVFILCHEIIHFKNKHSIDGFIKDNTAFKNSAYADNIDLLASAAYSKDKEREADEQGIEIFKQLGYALEDALGVFEVFEYIHLPFEEVTFDKTFFEYGGLTWPNTFSLLEPDTIAPIKENNVLFSTHPAREERKGLMQKAIDSLGIGERARHEKSITDEFLYARKRCRFETPLIALKKGEYCEAIYSAFILLRENPNSIYLNKIIAKALYGITTYSNFNNKKALELDYLKKQGELQKVVVFFQNMTAYEANALALNFIWRLKKKHSNDFEIDALFTRCLDNFTLLHGHSVDDFKGTALPQSLAVNKTKELIYYDYILKREPEKKKNTRFRLITPINPIYVDSVLGVDFSLRKKRFPYFFNSIVGDEDFNTALKKSITQNKALVDKVSQSLSQASIDSSKYHWNEVNPFYKTYLDAFYNEKNRLKKLKADSLNELYTGKFNNALKRKKGEKTLFFNPAYYSIDEREKIPLKYIASEKTRNVLFDRLTTSAKAAKVPVEFLSDDNFKLNDADKLNSISLLRGWLSEYYIHTGIDILPVEHEAITTFSRARSCEYISFTANFFYIRKKTDVASYVALSLILPLYSWPITFPYLFDKDVFSSYYLLTLDLNDRTMVAESLSSVRSKNKEDISLSTFYAFFNSLKLAQCGH